MKLYDHSTHDPKTGNILETTDRRIADWRPTIGQWTSVECVNWDGERTWYDPKGREIKQDQLPWAHN